MWQIQPQQQPSSVERGLRLGASIGDLIAPLVQQKRLDQLRQQQLQDYTTKRNDLLSDRDVQRKQQLEDLQRQFLVDKALGKIGGVYQTPTDNITPQLPMPKDAVNVFPGLAISPSENQSLADKNFMHEAQLKRLANPPQPSISNGLQITPITDKMGRVTGYQGQDIPYFGKQEEDTSEPATGPITQDELPSPNEPIQKPTGTLADKLYQTQMGLISARKGLDSQNELLNPDHMSGDVQDVLEGRNSIGNIKSTMGRSSKAAQYMEELRAKIRETDPKFDFAQSDAGVKLVSTPFYQKSMTALNTIKPNLDTMVQLSSQVPRVGIKGLDSIFQSGAIQFNNKKVANFHEARNLLADELGVALGQGGVSDMKLKLGLDLLDPNLSDEAFASNIGLIKHFLDNREMALNGGRYRSSTISGPQIGSTPQEGASQPAAPSPALNDFLKKHNIQ